MNMMFDAYFDRLAGRRAAVVGLGVSNIPLLRILCERGIDAVGCDRKVMEASEFESWGAEIVTGEDYLDCLKGRDVIFRSPGIRPDLPEFKDAVLNGAKLTSEMEAFFEVCPCPIIAVTGSDGKTTTTTIICEMLKADGMAASLGGNIGRPLLADAARMREDEYAVVELSSFQLMTLDRSPDIAVVTNVTPNHLDVHLSMEEYVAAKENIIRYQTMDQVAVLNGDNDITRKMKYAAQSEVRLFGSDSGDNHIYVSGGDIRYKNEPILPIKDILLPGAHNVENYMAAVGAVGSIVSRDAIRQVASSFRGVEHRIELVRVLGGVRYYNDSIASSPARTIAGLRSFGRKVILIAGGSDKNIPFDELAAEIIQRVSALILCGDTANKIKDAVEKRASAAGIVMNIQICGELEDAVKAARWIAEPEDVVMLSPACASFDMFENFAARGRKFKELVFEL